MLNSQTQPLPNPLAWYALNYLPALVHKMSVAATLVIEILVPFLFFATVARVRALAAFIQIAFQVILMVSGNFAFFNILTFVLCIPLFDDETLAPWASLFGVKYRQHLFSLSLVLSHLVCWTC